MFIVSREVRGGGVKGVEGVEGVEGGLPSLLYRVWESGVVFSWVHLDDMYL